MHVPRSISDVSDRWLSDALGRPVSITSIERIGEGFGLASEVSRVAVDGFAAGAVIVKLWPVDSKARATEVHFYNELGPHMAGDIPTHFHAAADDRRGVLVLEDLRGRQGDVLEPETTPSLVRIAELLARIHGRWWDHPELGTYDWLPDATTALPPEWFQSRRERLFERFGVTSSVVAQSLLHRAAATFEVASDRLLQLPKTLAHADHHLDNYLFVGERPVLLDWAGCRRGPGATDLVAVVFGMGGVDSADSLLDAYRAALEGEGIELGSAALESAVGGAVLRSFVTWTLGIANWVPLDERSVDLQHRSVEDAVRMVEFWANRDPASIERVAGRH